MYVSLFSVVINIILSIYLAKPYGVLGLATAFSISSILNMILLYVFLHRHVPDLDDQVIFISSLKIALNSLLAGSVAYLA
jgi:peptidoglycan biosynthesis protein MviN/MurJ (putative lipid II flippase)